MDKMHVIFIDDDLERKVKEFQTKLTEGTEIVSQSTHGNKLIIVTRETKKRSRNLLLEEHSK